MRPNFNDILPNFNPRRIKFAEDRAYTLEDQRARSKSNDLCLACGYINRCEARAYAVHHAKRVDATIGIKTCRTFQPVMTFRVLVGLNAPLFNSIRLGSAWHERVWVGGVITLANAPKKSLIGDFRVTAKHVGTVAELFPEHARHNHSMLDTNPDQAAELLFETMRSAYGRMTPIDQNSRVSVVYMEPVKWWR